MTDAWEPRYPLIGAEVFVDWQGHNNHIVEQRYRVEKAAAPTGRRLALSISQFGLPTNLLVDRMERVMIEELMRSVRFGYREAAREIRAQRAVSPGVNVVRSAEQLRARSSGTPDLGRVQSPAPAETILAYSIPDAGRRGRLARAGIPGIYGLVRDRSRQVAHAVVEAAHKASVATAATGGDRTAATIAVASAVPRTIHNSVLELVGESLNLGRTAAALEARPVPEFALRSEQLDKNTCEVCDHEHGEIYQVDSSEFWDHMPPNYCLGAGRCRGVYVFEAGAMSQAA